jgi:predicted nuclease of restriction endonuclease-like RecB superfamily
MGGSKIFGVNVGGGEMYTCDLIPCDAIFISEKGEAQYYSHLKILEKSQRKPDTKILELQPKIYLTDARILYKPDFLILENSVKIWIDYKGFSTPVFNIKAKLWKFYGPGELRIIKKNSKGFYVDKVINPVGGDHES